MLLGAQWLPRFGLRPESGASDASAVRARRTASGLAAEADRIAALLTAERPGPAPGTAPGRGPDRAPPTPLSVDLEVWMTSLAHQLTRIEASLKATPGTDPPDARPA